jgi:hypothetical protein
VPGAEGSCASAARSTASTTSAPTIAATAERAVTVLTSFRLADGCTPRKARSLRYWQTQEFWPDTYEEPDFAMQ